MSEVRDYRVVLGRPAFVFTALTLATGFYGLLVVVVVVLVVTFVVETANGSTVLRCDTIRGYDAFGYTERDLLHFFSLPLSL